ncbi:Eukaryotic translation initiation factor 3 subunit K [Trinorchestia longiramus]|nr:Eukaryotic translation initiation factor 3 subunit K [Trinorchestia longiramus]
MVEEMSVTVASMLKGIERYNPENMSTLEHYVELQAVENAYDLEANLALLKLYQFNPGTYKTNIACLILLKALTNLPHTDFVLCKCLLQQDQMEEDHISRIIFLHDLLEMCQFKQFWDERENFEELVSGVRDFANSIRRYICHVVSITYQHIEKTALASLLGNLDDKDLSVWISRNNWSEVDGGYIFIANQEETVKTKNITEKIEFDSVATIMAACR